MSRFFGAISKNNCVEDVFLCSFLWGYYGYPPSYYEGINVDEYRYKCRAAMAKNDTVQADFVL